MAKVFDTDDPVELVRQDIEAGIGQYFAERDAAFTPNPNLEGEQFGDPARVVAIPWRYDCRHVGDFNGLFPTGRDLTIEGVTFVDRRDGKPQLHRYVDWIGALNQLGLTVSWRVPLPDEDYRNGLREVNQRSRDALNRDLNRS